MKDFRKLTVWNKAHCLVLVAYEATRQFPSEERFGLTSQLRRACVSIPTNIAEACGRNSDGELARFLEIAMGSASETEYLLMLSHDLTYLDQPVLDHLTADVTEIKRMLAALIGKINADRQKPRSVR